MSQVELAGKLGITQGMVSKLEKGVHPIEGPVAKLLEMLMAEEGAS